jgi:hypothetical protein
MYRFDSVELDVDRPNADQETARATAEELDILDLYAEYAGAAGCNYNTTAGSPITCERICARVQSQGGIVLQSFM